MLWANHDTNHDTNNDNQASHLDLVSRGIHPPVCLDWCYTRAEVANTLDIFESSSDIFG
jgi:hypothetical protein